MNRFVFLILCALLSCGPAQAWIHGYAGATGSAQLNVGGIDVVPANFINVLKTATYNFSTNSDAGLLDADGYPTSAPTGIISLTFPSSATWNNTTYTLSGAGTRIVPMNFANGSMSACSSPGSTVTITGCAGGNALFQPTASNWSVTFTVGAIGGFTIQLPTSGTYAAGTGEIALYRNSDATGQAAGEIFTPEYLTLVAGLNPKTIRPMGWVNSGSGNQSTEVKWAYRTHPTNLTWTGRQYVPAIWGGSITGTDALTMSALPSGSPSTWTANEMLQGVIANPATSITVSGAANNGSSLCRLTVNSSATLSTNQVVWVAGIAGAAACNSPTSGGSTTSTITVIDATHIDLQGTTFSGAYTSGGRIGTQTLTVAGKSGGAKFVANLCGGIPLGCFDSMNAGLATFFYDSVLDRVIYSNGGITAGPPIEAQVNLANKSRSNLWPVVPAFAEDDYVTQWAAKVRDTLNSGLYFYPEYMNEGSFNTNFPTTLWGGQRGIAFGFPIGNNEHIFGWMGTRVRQINGNLIPAVFAGQMSRVRRALMFQAAGGSNLITYYMQGHDLAPSGTSTGIGNSVYSTFTGSADYTTKPNRPIDVVEVIGYAPYAGGANLMFGPDINSGGNPTSVNASFYQALVNAWDAGNTATAIALVDDDIRQGRSLVQNVTASGTTLTTPAAHGLTTNAHVAFQVTGGTSYAGLTAGAIYNVTGTSTAGCPGAVICNFTIQGYSGGNPSGANINAGAAGSGTVTVGWVGGGSGANIQTMQALNSNWYQFAETTAASFDSDRPAGMAALRVEQYEGALQPWGPSAAQCTSLGITTTNGAGACSSSVTAASIPAAIEAWRADNMAALTIKAYYSQFMGQDASMIPTSGLMVHSKTPAHLVLPGPINTQNPYALIAGNKPDAIKFGLYNGFAAFNSGVR